MKIKVEQREQKEMQELHLKLIAFLKDNPDYQWVETPEGVLVVISPLNYKLDTGLVAEKGAKLQ